MRRRSNSTSASAAIATTGASAARPTGNSSSGASTSSNGQAWRRRAIRTGKVEPTAADPAIVCMRRAWQRVQAASSAYTASVAACMSARR